VKKVEKEMFSLGSNPTTEENKEASKKPFILTKLLKK
jgi:hypothetical protein